MAWLVALFICLSSYSVYAEGLLFFNGTYHIANGKYYVEEDAGGVYIRTDKHGKWYLDKKDSENFKIGVSGIYCIETDKKGSFIITDEYRKIYVNQQALKDIRPERNESDEDYYQTVEVIYGLDMLWTNSSCSGIYATREEARWCIKGEPTIEWERRKAREEARRRAVLEARRRAELEAQRRAMREMLLEEKHRASSRVYPASVDTRGDVVYDPEAGGLVIMIDENHGIRLDAGEASVNPLTGGTLIRIGGKLGWDIENGMAFPMP